MKVPRLRLAWLMALVAVAALDLAVIRAAVEDNEMLFVWGLLMANLLVATWLLRRGRQGGRPPVPRRQDPQ